MEISRRKILKTAGAVGASTFFTPYIARAANKIKLTIASSHPTAVPWVGTMHDYVVPRTNERLKKMGSDIEVSWTESYGGALYKYDKTLEAVEQGITDIGWVGTLWEESKMPLQNVSYYAPFVSDDMPTMLRVMNEMHRDMDSLGDAWSKQNQVYLGASGIETYNIISKEPINSIADLKGKKFATAGAVSAWLQNTGAVGVNQGLPGFYNLIKTGVVDGAVISNTGTFPFKLYEVAPYINQVKLGCQVTGAMAINRKRWDKLPEELQIVLRKLGEDYSDIHGKMLLGLASKFEGLMSKSGATINPMSDDARLEWANSLPDLAGGWRKFNSDKGLPAKEVMDTFLKKMKEAGSKSMRDWSV
ncbi:MAG: C4-dicarboxylate TRAP transporter substrate-binding protein [Sneathiella sp.]|nr:C4-dicarboxylate TRAP transporter substrate-binding protein [Sneathiella sp.]